MVLLGSFRAGRRCHLIPFCSAFSVRLTCASSYPFHFNNQRCTRTRDQRRYDTGCGSGANYPLSTPMIKVQNKTLLGSSQKLLYLQNSHCLVSIHKDFECQHDINDMTLCLKTSGSMRHQSLICGHRQVAFPQVVTCHLATCHLATCHLATLNRSFEHLSHIENHGALLHPYVWVVLSWHTRSRMTAPNRFDDTIH